MSQENVEVVRRMWDAFLSEDPVSGLSFCDPDIKWDGTNLPDGTIARGREAIVEHAMRWAEQWEDWRTEPERFIDAGGDQVILVFRETGRSESGLQMDERHAELYRLRDGLVVYRKGFSDPDEALQAVGLSESSAGRTSP
jgi:ketosteroid isomerase-like protein